MRLVKCSDRDHEFASEAAMHHFFNETLLRKGARFYFVGAPIGKDGLYNGETLLFQYHKQIRFAAKAASSRLTDPTTKQHYFMIDVNTIYETKPINYLELQDQITALGLKASFKGQGWAHVEDCEALENLIATLHVRKLGTKKLEEDDLDILLGKHSKSPAFQQNIERRRAAELHAMELATLHFSKDYNVQDVSARESFDLLCTNKKTGELLRVEVKGTTGAGDEVVLTRNEVNNAREHKVALFILAHIEIKDVDGKLVGRGGVETTKNPWDLQVENLDPLSYSYKVKS